MVLVHLMRGQGFMVMIPSEIVLVTMDGGGMRQCVRFAERTKHGFQRYAHHQ